MTRCVGRGRNSGGDKGALKPLVLNTCAVEEVARAQFVHEALAMTMVPVELHWPQPPRGVAAHGVITDPGDLTVGSIQTSAFKVERTPALARDARVPAFSTTCN